MLRPEATALAAVIVLFIVFTILSPELFPTKLTYISVMSVAAELGIVSGDRAEVRSVVGAIEIEVLVTERIEPGHIFTAFHFPEIRTNLLIGASADVNTSCPEYKVVAVAVTPIGRAAGVPELETAAT